MKRYNPVEIEKKWQATWEKNETYKVDFSDHTKPKYYGFTMLPGITGAGIHVGHGRSYQFSDIKVRAKRQQGYNAYHPVGWDSFGLPVENYAIKIGKTPRVAHDEARVIFKNQLKRLGYSYDWSKEISTADPSYYRWTQWIFNQLFTNGLAYQKQSPQWWCETDQTVLANEQVEGGKCWRCGNQVSKRNLKQWFFKITDYADEILEATDDLDWTPMVKTMQKNWIGKSQGAEVDFKVEGRDDTLTVFTTRPDTLFGATFVVLAPEHELVDSLMTDETRDGVQAYVAEAARKSEIERMNETREKTGVFTGSYAINPVNGGSVPIWVADYVLSGYGTGAIMAVPAHDERDYEFAQKFGIEIVEVVLPYRIDKKNPPVAGKKTVERQTVHGIVFDSKTNKYLCLKWKQFGWTAFITGGVESDDEGDLIASAKREITEETGYKNLKPIRVMGGQVVSEYLATHKDENRKAFASAVLFELVDSEKIEVSVEESAKHEPIWLDLADITAETMTCAELDIWLSRLEAEGNLFTDEGILTNSGKFDGMLSSDAREQIVAWLESEGAGRNKISYKMRDWLISRQRYWGAPIPIIHCDDCGAVPVPDDQLPVILPDIEDFKPKDGNTSALATVTDWVNVPCPKCGKPAKRETDTMDGYACSSWYHLRYLDPFNDKQAWDPAIENHWGPVDYYNGADHAVAHLLYARFWQRFFYKLGLVSHPEPFKRMMYNAYILAADGTKMSKSRHNVVDPLELMDSGYGADSLRVYEMFIAPYDMEAPWDTRGVPGTYRFLNRVWTLVQEYIDGQPVQLDESASREILAVAHHTAKKVTADIEDEKFNTSISAMMEAVNGYYKLKTKLPIGKCDAWDFAIESLLQVLSPFAPHITEELWEQTGHTSTIHVDCWPVWDEQYMQTDTITIVASVNGKVRAKLEVAKDISEDEAKKLALDNKNVQAFIGDQKPIKVIYVPGRLVNIVI
ncbi:MAG: class I tRNA ligase family protein [Candidatus Saccharibacteria bacterium]